MKRIRYALEVPHWRRGSYEPLAVGAEILVLRIHRPDSLSRLSGQTGWVLEGDAETVRVELPGGTVWLLRAQVEEVRRLLSGAELRRERRRLGVTQIRLGAAMGLTVGGDRCARVSNLERRRWVTADAAERYRRALAALRAA